MSTRPKWQQCGRISLWRYTENERNFSGWHLNADAEGCASLLSLLDALESSPGEYRTVRITAPTAAVLRVPNNRGGRAAWLAPAKLRLCCSPVQACWVFPLDLDPASLTVGADWLPRLREGIGGIPEGRGDYSIGSDAEPSLWFWW